MKALCGPGFWGRLPLATAGMTRLAIAEAFVEKVAAAKSAAALHEALITCCGQMGVTYFALLHHVDFARDPQCAIRLHNYPTDYQRWFDEQGLGRSDPVHRASHATSIGFKWTAVPRLIKLTPEDRGVLQTARRFGIGDGFTVPANIPGEVDASCSFAVAAGDGFPAELQYVAQLSAVLRLKQLDAFQVDGIWQFLIRRR